MIIDTSGNARWKNSHGYLHREDGPAIEYSDGAKEWWVNGKRHREDGPAIIWSDGDKEWYQNGVLHRLDGPAHDWSIGPSEYWVAGVQYTEELTYWLIAAEWKKSNNA